MPAIVHSSPGLAARRVALLSQSMSEESSGLVTAVLRYVSTSANRNFVDTLFFTDAAPPVFPSSIDRGRLINRTMYLLTRKIEEEHGLVTIEATYLGGRTGLKPVVNTDFESPINVEVRSEEFTISTQNPLDPSQISVTSGLTDFYAYTYTPLVQTVETVKIGNTLGDIPTPPLIESLYALASFESAFWRQFNSGVQTYSKPRQWFIDLINSRGVLTEQKTQRLTPTVGIVTTRYSIA